MDAASAGPNWLVVAAVFTLFGALLAVLDHLDHRDGQ
jgi:hypothetical protein